LLFWLINSHWDESEIAISGDEDGVGFESEIISIDGCISMKSTFEQEMSLNCTMDDIKCFCESKTHIDIPVVVDRIPQGEIQILHINLHFLLTTFHSSPFEFKV